MHGAEVKAVDCPAIDGIIKEANEIVGDIGDKSVLDAAIVAAAQAVEHYEITRYGTLATWAKQLGREDCAAVLAEKGCIEYGAAIDARGLPPSKGSVGEDTFLVIEKWASLADLQAHAAAPHMAAYGAKTKEWVERKMIHILEPV